MPRSPPGLRRHLHRLQPGAGIQAVGAIEEKPAVHDGERSRPSMEVTCACDRLVFYGAVGARFLAQVKGLLEPLTLAL